MKINRPAYIWCCRTRRLCLYSTSFSCRHQSFLHFADINTKEAWKGAKRENLGVLGSVWMFASVWLSLHIHCRSDWLLLPAKRGWREILQQCTRFFFVMMHPAVLDSESAGEDFHSCPSTVGRRGSRPLHWESILYFHAGREEKEGWGWWHSRKSISQPQKAQRRRKTKIPEKMEVSSWDLNCTLHTWDLHAAAAQDSAMATKLENRLSNQPQQERRCDL